jgi:hypothetical protein
MHQRRDEISLKWLYSYFVLYCLPFPLGAVTGTDWFAEEYGALWNLTAQRIGMFLLRVPAPLGNFQNGSGDSMGAYVRLLSIVIVATVAAIAWSLLDRRRELHGRLRQFIPGYVRYFLGATMVGYGLHKVFNLQFVPGRSSSRMLETYGESSPFALAWTFMGGSTAYTIVSGAAEAIGGLLVFFRRCSLPGLLLLLPVTANVVLLNFCYDIGVKVESSHLLFMVIFLLAPDRRSPEGC